MAQPESKVELGAGSGIVFGKGQPVTKDFGYICTLTAVGYDEHGNLVGLTNAHCFTDDQGNKVIGDEVYADKVEVGTSLHPTEGFDPDFETGVVGHVRHVSKGNITAFPEHGLDYAVIELDENKVQPTNTVGETTVTEIGPPPAAGSLVCKQGRTTGVTCGTMLVNIGFYFTHTIFELPGDSGSPVTSGTTLVGNQWVAAGSTSIMAVLEDMNARGEIGAGFTLPTP